MWRRVTSVVLVLMLASTAAACERSESGASSSGGDGFRRLLRGTDDAPWDVRVGVEQVTVTGATPGQPLTLYGPRRNKLLTLLADELGQAHFAYLPPEHATVQSGPNVDLGAMDAVHGTTVEPGRYVVIDESAEPRLASEVLTVPDRDDVPDQDLYDGQELTGARLDILGNPRPGAAIDEGFQYLEMRDGVVLSANVRFPDEAIYGPAPWPTVVEYSGYSPSNPASEEAGVRIARALGYATVSVNMRGTGLLGRRVRRVQPRADGRRLRHDRDRGRPGLGARRPGRHGRPVLLGHHAALHGGDEPAAPGGRDGPVRDRGPVDAGVAGRHLQLRLHPAVDQGAQRGRGPGGSSWVTRRIDAGDAVCAENQALRNQNPDFENLARSLTTYTRSAAARDLRRLVPDIDGAGVHQRRLPGRADRPAVHADARRVRRGRGVARSTCGTAGTPTATPRST